MQTVRLDGPLADMWRTPVNATGSATAWNPSTGPPVDSFRIAPAVDVNQHLIIANEMPFGGFGRSGYGKELFSHAIDEYSQVKHVMLTDAPA
jgi:acyl-CoA reductase-like NAD-dependent aldehyde dehydrogenase